MRSDARTQVNRTALGLRSRVSKPPAFPRRLRRATREGLIANKFRWRQTVTELRPASDTRPPQGCPAAPANGALRSFWVEVAVEAPDGTAIKLAALKLATEAKP